MVGSVSGNGVLHCLSDNSLNQEGGGGTRTERARAHSLMSGEYILITPEDGLTVYFQPKYHPRYCDFFFFAGLLKQIKKNVLLIYRALALKALLGVYTVYINQNVFCDNKLRC